MKILTDSQNSVIFSNDVITGIVENETKYWKYSDTCRIFDQGYACHEVSSVPDNVQSYCYTVAKGFYANPNWVAPPKSLETILEDLVLAKAESELEIDERISKLELGLA